MNILKLVLIYGIKNNYYMLFLAEMFQHMGMVHHIEGGVGKGNAQAQVTQ